jgi:hypothetical protein
MQMNAPIDSLDIVELVMAIEVAFSDKLPLDANERERVIREITERLKRSGFPDCEDLNGDDFTALVRNLVPRDPRGQSGAAAAKPEEPFA